MAAPKGLVLYGDSVFLAGIKAALKGYDALEPITLESGRSGICGHIQEMNPRAVLFDRFTAEPDVVLRLLCDRPNLVVIGVNASSDEIVILSVRKEHVSSIAELVNVIGQRSDSVRPVSS